MIAGRCPVSLTGLHVPDRKDLQWCRSCDKGRPLPQRGAQRRPTTEEKPQAEPVEEWEDCPADPSRHGIHWRMLSDPDSWCRACGRGNAPIAAPRHHAITKFNLPGHSQAGSKPYANPLADQVSPKVRAAVDQVIERRAPALRALAEADQAPERQARTADPVTSKRAARTFRRGSIPQRCVEYITNNPGSTRDEIAHGLNLKPPQVWRRLSELVRDGWLRYGEARTGDAGMGQQTLWPAFTPPVKGA